MCLNRILAFAGINLFVKFNITRNQKARSECQYFGHQLKKLLISLKYLKWLFQTTLATRPTVIQWHGREHSLSRAQDAAEENQTFSSVLEFVPRRRSKNGEFSYETFGDHRLHHTENPAFHQPDTGILRSLLLGLPHYRSNRLLQTSAIPNVHFQDRLPETGRSSGLQQWN